MAFTPGVLAFTRVITADQIGIQLGNGAPPRKLARFSMRISTSIPAIRWSPSLRPRRSRPTRNPTTSNRFSRTNSVTLWASAAVWSAMMFPFAPAPGTLTGLRVVLIPLRAPSSRHRTIVPAPATPETLRRAPRQPSRPPLETPPAGPRRTSKNPNSPWSRQSAETLHTARPTALPATSPTADSVDAWQTH